MLRVSLIQKALLVSLLEDLVISMGGQKGPQGTSVYLKRWIQKICMASLWVVPVICEAPQLEGLEILLIYVSRNFYFSVQSIVVFWIASFSLSESHFQSYQLFQV